MNVWQTGDLKKSTVCLLIKLEVVPDDCAQDALKWVGLIHQTKAKFITVNFKLAYNHDTWLKESQNIILTLTAAKWIFLWKLLVYQHNVELDWKVG